MRSLMVLLVAAIGLDLGAAAAEASCRMQTLAEHADRADVVAFGTARGSSFEIKQVLKGQASGTVQVRFGEGGSGVVTSVDYMHEDGDHTLYLTRDGSAYATNSCTGSHPGLPTTEERAFFGVGEAPTARPGDAIPIAGGAAATGLILALAALTAGAIAVIVLLRARGKATV